MNGTCETTHFTAAARCWSSPQSTGVGNASARRGHSSADLKAPAGLCGPISSLACRRTGVANRSETDQETVSAWLTAHPELILGSLGEFETCPDWVPSMDTARPSASMMMKNKIVHGFDHTANWIAKVRNVSRLGRQPSLLFSGYPLLLLQLAGGNVRADAKWTRTSRGVVAVLANWVVLTSQVRTRSDISPSRESHLEHLG